MNRAQVLGSVALAAVLIGVVLLAFYLPLFEGISEVTEEETLGGVTCSGLWCDGTPWYGQVIVVLAGTTLVVGGFGYLVLFAISKRTKDRNEQESGSS